MLNAQITAQLNSDLPANSTSATSATVPEVPSYIDTLPPLPLAYSDPEAYLAQPNFHKTLNFTPTFLSSSSPSFSPAADDGSTPAQHTVSYASVGSCSTTAPTIFWINGMGGHRLAAGLFDGYAKSKGVRFYSMDRPGSGSSTLVSLKDRVRWTYEAFKEICNKEEIGKVSLLSHSNGVIYTLYIMLELAKEEQTGIEVTSWSLSSPWVPPWISGSRSLNLARWIPAGATSNLGPLMKLVINLAGPASVVSGWSTGVARDVASVISSGTSFGQKEIEARRLAERTSRSQGKEEPLKPDQEYARLYMKNVNAPREKKLITRQFISPRTFDLAMGKVFEEGTRAPGQEAMICIRVGEAFQKGSWGWGEDEDESITASDEAKLLERGFGKLKQIVDAKDEPKRPKFQVFFGTDDGLIPEKGRDYLKKLLVDDLKLVADEDWIELEGRGHDDTLTLEIVAQPVFNLAIDCHD